MRAAKAVLHSCFAFASSNLSVYEHLSLIGKMFENLAMKMMLSCNKLDFTTQHL